MKVKVIREFRDVESNLSVKKIDDIFEVSKQRGEFLINKNFAVEVKELAKKDGKNL